MRTPIYTKEFTLPSMCLRGKGIKRAVRPLCAAIRLWLEALETVPLFSPRPIPQLQLATWGFVS